MYCRLEGSVLLFIFNYLYGMVRVSFFRALGNIWQNYMCMLIWHGSSNCKARAVPAGAAELYNDCISPGYHKMPVTFFLRRREAQQKCSKFEHSLVIRCVAVAQGEKSFLCWIVRDRVLGLCKPLHDTLDILCPEGFLYGLFAASLVGPIKCIYCFF